MRHQHFITTTAGIDRTSPPMRLYEKAKKLGVWNPSDLDFSRDQLDWKRLAPDEQQVILHLTSLFQGGEEAVTLDLLPMIMVIAREGRLEEEMFLTTFLFEEAKHTDFFNRFLIEVVGDAGDLSRFHSDNYRQIFYQSLPETMNILQNDASAAALVRASVTYNLIVEGVLAETGYHAFFSMLARHQIMPGLQHGILLLKQDESRHIAYGIYLLSRMIAVNPKLWEVLDDQMTALLTPALGVINDIFACYDPVPFGLVEDDFVNFAIDQYSKRFARLEKARQADLRQVDELAIEALDE